MLTRIRDVLIDAVLAGAVRVLDVRRRGPLASRFKDATELVTEADRQADAAILKVFQERFPGIDRSISFRLEESGVTGTEGRNRVGADPLDGTSHFAAGGQLYSVQAHYLENGIPMVGVVFQPEVFLPMAEADRASGRLVSATRGGGAFASRSEFVGGAFQMAEPRRVTARQWSGDRPLVACVPFSGKMAPHERALARKVHESGIIGATVGTGGAGGNVMMAVFGGQDVYANFGAGEDLDLVPPQVIASEVGLTVWGPNRQPPVWHVRKQPFIVAPNDETAERFLKAAGL